MPTMTQINDADLKFFDRLADMTADRHCLPRKFYNVEPEVDFEGVLTPTRDLDGPAYVRVYTFTFEDMDEGLGPEILCRSMAPDMEYEDRLSLIWHLSTTGEAAIPTSDRVDAAGLGSWLGMHRIMWGAFGIAMGMAAIIVSQQMVAYGY